MYHRNFFHLVWTTRERRPAIDLPRAQFLAHYLPIVARQERGAIRALGIVSTHVHILIQADPVLMLPRVMQRFKGGSSTLVSQQRIGNPQNPLRWAKGYSSKTVGEQSVQRVIEYVESQSRRHPAEAIAGWVTRTATPDMAASAAIAETRRSLMSHP